MRTFNLNEKFLSGLRRRLEEASPPSPPSLPDVVLGIREEPDENFYIDCSTCGVKTKAAYLLPAYGYVCGPCGVLLVVRALLDRLPSSGSSAPPPAESPGLPPARETGGDKAIDALPGVTAMVETREIPAHTGDVAKADAPSPGASDIDGRKEPPALHGSPKVVTGMKSFREVPPGTVIRIPLPQRHPRKPEHHVARIFTSEPPDFVEPVNVIVRKASEEGIVLHRPEVDLSRLVGDDREVFSGYTPGKFVFRNAGDVRRYEGSCGDPELMEISAAEDDEELGEVERELQRRNEARMPSGAAVPTRQDGVMRLRTSDPSLREGARRLDISGFEPLRPID